MFTTIFGDFKIGKHLNLYWVMIVCRLSPVLCITQGNILFKVYFVSCCKKDLV